jgi:hypothetical protein
MLHKKFNAYLLETVFSFLMLLLASCNNSSSTNAQDDCLKGLTEPQKEVINKMIALLKDTSKITAQSAIGFSAFINKEGKDFTEDANSVSNYTQGYLSDFFRILDLTELPIADADKYYDKYVAEKCKELELKYPTLDSKETKSVLVSTDSIYKLASELWAYQNQSNRKTGIRVVFANYDDVDLAGVKKSGDLTYFMVGTIDTLLKPASTFNWHNQKDLTILSAGWGIPAWGLSAYNHGELCPNSCGAVGENTKYYK